MRLAKVPEPASTLHTTSTVERHPAFYYKDAQERCYHVTALAVVSLVVKCALLLRHALSLSSKLVLSPIGLVRDSILTKESSLMALYALLLALLGRQHPVRRLL